MKLVFMSQDMNYEDYLNNQKKKVTHHLTGIPFFTHAYHADLFIFSFYYPTLLFLFVNQLHEPIQMSFS